MTVPNELYDLVERFDRDIDAFKHNGFNERQLTKGDFIEPADEASRLGPLQSSRANLRLTGT